MLQPALQPPALVTVAGNTEKFVVVVLTVLCFVVVLTSFSSPTRMYPCTLPGCSGVAKSKTALSTHKTAFHKLEYTTKFRDVSYTIIRPGPLDRVTCPLASCTYSVTAFSALTTHLRKQHSNNEKQPSRSPTPSRGNQQADHAPSPASNDNVEMIVDPELLSSAKKKKTLKFKETAAVASGSREVRGEEQPQTTPSSAPRRKFAPTLCVFFSVFSRVLSSDLSASHHQVQRLY